MTGIELIAAERERQITEEGWTASHDAKHDEGEIARAAAVYAMPSELRERTLTAPSSSLAWPISDWTWPWDPEWFKPTPDDRVRELAKAGALIAAEIDRLAAAAPRCGGGVHFHGVGDFCECGEQPNTFGATA